MLPLRIYSLAVNELNGSGGANFDRDDNDFCLWRASLDLCVNHNGAKIDSTPRHHTLAVLDIDFNSNGARRQRTDTPVIGPLTTLYPQLVPSLQVLVIRFNNYDESNQLATLASLAPRLRALTFMGCGLSSLEGLLQPHPQQQKQHKKIGGEAEVEEKLGEVEEEGKENERGSLCEHLRYVDLRHCRGLTSIDALRQCTMLRELNVCYTRISSMRPMQSCRALTKVDCHGFRMITSLDGLQEHPLLEVVVASHTGIASVRELLNCRALRKVDLSLCQQLTSLDGLRNHAYLEELDASDTAISSICELQTCLALEQVVLHNCRQLTSLEGLENHLRLEMVLASWTDIASVEPLLTCPVLNQVDLHDCKRLASLHGLQGHAHLDRVDVHFTAITSVKELLDGCPALRRVNIDGCRQLLPSEADAFVDACACIGVHVTRPPPPPKPARTPAPTRQSASSAPPPRPKSDCLVS